MTVTIKILGRILDHMRIDLRRSHKFAHERIGFMTANLATNDDELIMMVRDYTPVADDDYERAAGVGAQIGSNAIRKALQSAYRPQSAFLHIHTHGGRGRPGFSGTDLRSGQEFVPSFFNTLPKMPHGLIVLSDDSVTGLLWYHPERNPVDIGNFVRVDSPYFRDWTNNELA